MSADQTALRRAGAAGLEVNAPMSAERLESNAALIVESEPRTVLDLGCGRAAFLRRAVLHAGDGTRGVGVDDDGAVVAAARDAVRRDGLEGRVTIEEAPAGGFASGIEEPVDRLILVGAEHALGGLQAAVDTGRRIARRMLLGLGVFPVAPTPWVLDAFGPLPSPYELGRLVQDAGWTVSTMTLSTLAEWDAFEHGWLAGVRAVGTETALSFAERREAEYARYRGVLGFAWVDLR